MELTRITPEDDEDDDDETSDVIIFLKRILNCIEYSLISKTVDDEIYYSIKSRPQYKSYTNNKPVYNLNYCL